MKKYKATDSEWNPRIEVVEVEKESDASVWINGWPCRKMSGHESYFDTWDEAQAHLLKFADLRVDVARRRLEKCKSVAGNVKGMKRPHGD